jgi:hypothetical protein
MCRAAMVVLKSWMTRYSSIYRPFPLRFSKSPYKSPYTGGLMNGNEPATKADLEQLRSETTHQYNDLVERIDDSKTELLSAFYAFAKSDQKRIAHVEG